MNATPQLLVRFYLFGKIEQNPKFGFTGNQTGMTSAQKQVLTDVLSRFGGDFHHGDCIGSDAEAAAIARRLELLVVTHPPICAKKRAYTTHHIIRPEYDYLVRNRHIVDETDLLIVMPREFEEQLRSGTWSTYRYARRKGKPTLLVYPDGRIKHELN